MKMFVIVVGCGRLGSRLARILSTQDHDVAVVADSAELKRLGNNFDGVKINGIPIDEDVLKQAGIASAHVLVAVTSDDNVNVMVAQIAKEIFKVPMVLARISDPEREDFYKHLGLNTVCPTNTGINQIIKLLQHNEFSPFAGYINSRVINVKPSQDWIGLAVKDLNIPKDMKVVGVLKDDLSISIDFQKKVEDSDTLILAFK
jgi:trk system potassium uptake protein TrkA